LDHSREEVTEEGDGGKGGGDRGREGRRRRRPPRRILLVGKGTSGILIRGGEARVPARGTRPLFRIYKRLVDKPTPPFPNLSPRLLHFSSRGPGGKRRDRGFYFCQFASCYGGSAIGGVEVCPRGRGFAESAGLLRAAVVAGGDRRRREEVWFGVLRGAEGLFLLHTSRCFSRILCCITLFSSHGRKPGGKSARTAFEVCHTRLVNVLEHKHFPGFH